MNEQSRVLILGYGEMGHAMEHLLHENQQLDIWEKFPRNNVTSVILEEAAARADIVLFCLPVNPHREVASLVAPLLKENCLCISIAKGLDEAGQTAAQIFTDVFAPHQAFALLYGPMIAEEIRSDLHAFAQLGCKDADEFKRTRDLFHNTRLYIEPSSDIAGISWSVILKNVYALLFGIADELQLGDNMRGYLAVAALQELDQIVRHMGGQSGSSYHLSGLGDLVTTATSEHSHHHELGRMLAREKMHGIQGEGIHTLDMVGRYQLFNTDNYPLFQLIHAIVHQPLDVDKRINAYLKQVFL